MNRRRANATGGIGELCLNATTVTAASKEELGQPAWPNHFPVTWDYPGVLAADLRSKIFLKKFFKIKKFILIPFSRLFKVRPKLS
jgi:hypothetical protein